MPLQPYLYFGQQLGMPIFNAVFGSKPVVPGQPSVNQGPTTPNQRTGPFGYNPAVHKTSVGWQAGPGRSPYPGAGYDPNLAAANHNFLSWGKNFDRTFKPSSFAPPSPTNPATGKPYAYGQYAPLRSSSGATMTVPRQRALNTWATSNPDKAKSVYSDIWQRPYTGLLSVGATNSTNTNTTPVQKVANAMGAVPRR